MLAIDWFHGSLVAGRRTQLQWGGGVALVCLCVCDKRKAGWRKKVQCIVRFAARPCHGPYEDAPPRRLEYSYAAAHVGRRAGATVRHRRAMYVVWGSRGEVDGMPARGTEYGLLVGGHLLLS